MKYAFFFSVDSWHCLIYTLPCSCDSMPDGASDNCAIRSERTDVSLDLDSWHCLIYTLPCSCDSMPDGASDNCAIRSERTDVTLDHVTIVVFP